MYGFGFGFCAWKTKAERAATQEQRREGAGTERTQSEEKPGKAATVNDLGLEGSQGEWGLGGSWDLEAGVLVNFVHGVCQVVRVSEDVTEEGKVAMVDSDFQQLVRGLVQFEG